MDIHAFLAVIWYLLLGLILVLYVVTDGFDLGIGILTLCERDDSRRMQMMAAVSGVWDANETWLVLFGGALFGAFPGVYAVTLHALYVPLSALLFGLVVRGIAFAFSEQARDRRGWTRAFGGGSLVAALAQGYMLGAVITGLPVAGGDFTGSIWSWFGPFSSVVAVGVTAGYALLGGTFLIIKTSGELQARSRLQSRRAAWIMLAAAACVTVVTPLAHNYIARRWFSLPAVIYLSLLPLAALVACARLRVALARGSEYAPFAWSIVIFVLSFVGLAASLYPYLVPPVMSLSTSAASSSTLVFMLVGIGMLLPVMIVYNGFQYLVFRGKLLPVQPRHAAVARTAGSGAGAAAATGGASRGGARVKPGAG
ncbi:MAG: cytochrome d ubiquinol oxidase subunit II [Pseudomonadota bacterium]